MVTCCLLCWLKALNSLRYYFHKIQRPRRPRQNVPGKPNLLRQTRSNPTVANARPSSGEATCLWSCSIISDHVKSSGCSTACSVLSVLRQGELADNVRCLAWSDRSNFNVARTFTPQCSCNGAVHTPWRPESPLNIWACRGSMRASIALSGLVGCSLISVGLLEHNGRSKFSDWRVLAFLLVT